MSDIFKIKEGDTSPSIQYALSPASVVNLTGATVVFNMRLRNDQTVKVSRQAAMVVIATGTPTVQYDWASGDTDTRGTYQAEFEVTYSDGSIETFPNDDFIKISITGDVA